MPRENKTASKLAIEAEVVERANYLHALIPFLSSIRALVVFVRKHAPEVQYPRTTISEEQRQEIGRLAASTINQIEAGHFNPHSGIRFPLNGCMSCPHLGLCLGNEQLVAANLIRKAGRATLIGLTSFWIKGRAMAPPKLNRRRALFVLGKIGEILAWEKTKEQERDVRLCGSRALSM